MEEIFEIRSCIEILVEAWLGIQQSVIDQAIDQWRVHLNACVKAKGKHFEHMLL